MSSAISFTPTTATSPTHRQSALHAEEDDPRPSSTSVVATLRHSPRLLLRKKASALKEPAQSPDIFARGPGPALRASTRLQTRNASARMLKSRSKKTSRQQQQQEQTGRPSTSTSSTSQYTSSTSSRNEKTSILTQPTAATTAVMTSHQMISTDMVVDGTVQTKSSRSISTVTNSTSGTMTTAVTEPTESSPTSPESPTSRILAASGHRPTSIATEETNGLSAVNTERRSRMATRSTSRTREAVRTRTRTSRTRARSRTIPTKTLKEPGMGMEKSDEDDEDEDEDDARIRYHLRSPAHHRRRRSMQKSTAAIAPNVSIEPSSVSGLAMAPRLTRLGARHESGHDLVDELDQEQQHLCHEHLHHHHKRHLENAEDEHNQQHARRSRSNTSTSSQDSHAAKTKASTTTYVSSGAQEAPRKVKKKAPDHHKVPSLPVTRRRLRARTTKVAKMGIDGEGAIDDEEEEDEDEEEEEEEEDEDVEYGAYPRSDPDEEMMDVEEPSSGLQLHQQTMEDVSATTSHDTLDGFIASKPEVPLANTGVGVNIYAVQQSLHQKRKVDDENMEDAPILSMDEGQVVSTKLARIDEASDGDKNAYLKTFYNILKSPRGDDDDGILSSESEDADLESEDDDDDFEEIDVWEFIATLPPLGPLPLNFIFTMPERTVTTPPITLVLDIDETLVHCATRPLDSPDIVFPVEYNQETWEVYGRIRPGMIEFLERMSTKFEVITFTASQECYAEALLKIIDPEKKYIKHRYYRDSCVPVFGNYVKDLRILNRDLSKVVIIDNSPQAFGYHISNGIPIESWYDDKSDRELSKVMSFLETLEGVEDVRPRIDEYYKLQERIQKALALASHQQISSMSGLGALGATLSTPLSSLSSAASSSSSSTSTPSAIASNAGSLASMPSSGATEITSTMTPTAMQNVVVPDNVDMDATMMMYDEVEKPPSPSDDDNEHEEDEEKTVRGRRSKSKLNATTATSHAMTMKTRSNSLDPASNLAKISL
ncbi:hypothetical protein BG011_006432 [Mortierella polycephala]|uniref:FCP1 homology domain-containing protein n=1 Tax=Mortierella polycephala TaxID=41804 RepID=A0A9P6PW31_9FUNG|nr:hypothetical protein BG011_006432 [Mortierella polycephala]